MKNIAIILARGGSKRIPKKNIKKFFNKPAISYPILAALSSGCFDDVIVSTDDIEIKKISIKYGAKVPFIRSKKNSTDHATTIDVLNEVLSYYESNKIQLKSFCCLYGTSLFVTTDKLKKAYEMLILKKSDSIIPVAKFNYPIQRSLVIENEKLYMKWPENLLKRSQDLEPYYQDTGQYYFVSYDSFKINNQILTENTFPIIESQSHIQDIDNMEDWNLAKIKYKLLMNNL